MKRLLIFFIFGFLVFGLARSAYSATDCSGLDDTSRCATCDLCGYCFSEGTPQPTPQKWESCRNCLYPDLTGAPAEGNETLRIEPISNAAPSPYPGHWYTMVGCISTNLGFTGQGAAGSVVQTLLNIIFGAAGGIALLYILYGSFIILTSQADAERLNHGKRVVYGAIIGVIFSLSAVFLVNFVAGNVLKIPGFTTP